MKVAFMRGLPPERQEKVFDVWLNLQRHSDGGYSGDMIADAIIDRALMEYRAGQESGEMSGPCWYRRYRLAPRPRARPRTAVAAREAVRKGTRRLPAAA